MMFPLVNDLNAKGYSKYGYRMAYDVAVRNGESLGCERSVYTA